MNDINIANENPHAFPCTQENLMTNKSATTTEYQAFSAHMGKDVAVKVSD